MPGRQKRGIPHQVEPHIARSFIVKGEAAAIDVHTAMDVDCQGTHEDNQRRRNYQGTAAGQVVDDQADAADQFNPGQNQGRHIARQDRYDLVICNRLGKSRRILDFAPAGPNENTPQGDTGGCKE